MNFMYNILINDEILRFKMKKEKFNQILKNIGLSRQEFADITKLSYGAVSNWDDEKKPIPGWVESWLDNYIESKSYNEIKNKVYEIEERK